MQLLIFNQDKGHTPVMCLLSIVQMNTNIWLHVLWKYAKERNLTLQLTLYFKGLQYRISKLQIEWRGNHGDSDFAVGLYGGIPSIMVALVNKGHLNRPLTGTCHSF